MRTCIAKFKIECLYDVVYLLALKNRVQFNFALFFFFYNVCMLIYFFFLIIFNKLSINTTKLLVFRGEKIIICGLNIEMYKCFQPVNNYVVILIFIKLTAFDVYFNNWLHMHGHNEVKNVHKRVNKYILKFKMHFGYPMSKCEFGYV